jgi:hypothetical protein
MLSLVDVDELILGDKAYVPHFVFPVRDVADPELLELNRRISSVRLKVEHLIRRINSTSFFFQSIHIFLIERTCVFGTMSFQMNL